MAAQAQMNREFEYWRSPNAPIVDFSTTTSTIDVPDNFTIGSLSVLVDIDHPAASDLVISLNGPTGNYVLSTQNGMAGANYENTIFDSNPGAGIPGVAVNAGTNVTAFFRGVYIPETTLPTSGNPRGDWTLSVTDNLLGDNGTLVRWGLIFNRYDNYRDIRWGVDLNYLGVTTLNPFGLVDDVTLFPPYTVQGHRPLNNQVAALAAFQLSQTPGVLNIKIDHKYPTGARQSVLNGDFSLPAESPYDPVVMFNLQGQKGQHEAMLDLMMRGDLYMSRSDNYMTVPLDVTPGSLGYDNGVAMNTLFPFVNECDALRYTIYAPQTITSVDIWQGSVVELEPTPSQSRLTVNVWDFSTGGLVASTGAVEFPPQGDKWVTYPFSPPVSLPAGHYLIGYCLTAIDQGSFGPGVGMDEAGSPFEPDGFLSRYAGLNIQFLSFNGGTSWFEEVFRTFSTQMIRPNFVQLSDVGVIAINHTNSASGLDVTVTFGAYAHYSYLPNQMTFGKVSVIDNATNQTVGYQEKRVYLQTSPWIEQQTFNFGPIPNGSYTLKAEIVRPDDENLINNEYSRQISLPFAPMIVSTPGAISTELKDKIVSTYAQQGIQLEFVDRIFGDFTFPESGKILWVGSLDNNSGVQAREFVQGGGDFAVLPDLTTGVNPLAETFQSVATVKEIESMNRVLAVPQNVIVPDPSDNYFVAKMSNPTNELFSFGKVDDVKDRVVEHFSMLSDRKAPATFRDVSRITRTSSDEISVKAVRTGSLAVIQLIAKDPKPVKVIENIVNPTLFEVTQNYPNPFNPTTNIAYNVPTDANVSIRVFDMLGREISLLSSGFHNAGNYITSWDAVNKHGEIMPSGIYLYRMEASPTDGSTPFIMTKKMVLAR